MKLNETKRYISVVQMNNKEIYRVLQGPPNSFERTVVDPNDTNEELAFWKYENKKNRADVFQDTGRPAPDVGLVMLLTIIVDLLHSDEVMERAGARAVLG